MLRTGLSTKSSYAAATFNIEEALTHWNENIGNTTSRLIVVELKKLGR
jgi:hypothetical protein